jgi:hypothetical protein
MNDRARPDNSAAAERLRLMRQTRQADHVEPRTVTQPLSARAAAAQFDLAAILQVPPEPLRERALVAPGTHPGTNLTTRPSEHGNGEGDMQHRSEQARAAQEAGRLPSAWYKKADEIAEASRKERVALLVRGSAVVCLATGAALLFWLGAFGGRAMTEAPAQMTASLAPARRLPVATLVPPDRPEPAAVDRSINPSARALVTTAQILAVAERFVATGDILAARAMLSDTAAAGDGRALFALAETYDPHLLASWNARNIEASESYAKLLYEAALKAGVTDAQTRLDALK